MNCEQMTVLLSAWLDGEVTAQEEVQLQEHLAQCPACRALFEQLQTLHTSFSDLEEISAPEDFAQGVMSRIEAERKPKIVPLFKRPQVRAMAGLAACAVLCIGFGSFALNGGLKSSNTAMDAAPAAPAAMPESASYSMVEAPAMAEPEMQYDAAPSEPAMESVLTTAAPEERGSDEPAQAMPETAGGVRADGQADGLIEEYSKENAVILLQELPEGLEEALGQLQWEERIEDGALCAQLTAEQAETLLELVNAQGLSVEQSIPETGESEHWMLILSA